MNLQEQIEGARRDCTRQLIDLRDKYEKDTDAATELLLTRIESFCKLQGVTVCPKCQGIGREMRLDAGYMRRFGLREWDGCPECGGDRDIEGRGFLIADVAQK